MKTIAKWSLALALALTAASTAAQKAQPGIAPVSLAELARAADFVGVAQVKDTDYLRRRELPVSGSAYLQVLIAYKSAAAEGIIEVYEKGLREGECYFPNPDVFEEGRRYLLFLRRDPEQAERYRGLEQGCAIDLLVDRDNRYAVRLPVTGLAVTDALEERARPMQFSDRYAVVSDDALPPALREPMRDAGQIVPYTPDGEATTTPQWLYTRGIPLSEFRELLRLETWEPALPATETHARRQGRLPLAASYVTSR